MHIFDTNPSEAHKSTLSLPNQAQQILSVEGPDLQAFCRISPHQSYLSTLTCADFINKLQNSLQPGREIRLAGTGLHALFSGFSFALLAIGCKQIKYYPHLLTLIKEQFFKPGIFGEYDAHRRARVLSLCRNIEIQLISAGSVHQFLQANQQFLDGFIHVLNKITVNTNNINKSDQPLGDIVEAIGKKFNIDCASTKIPNSPGISYSLGSQKKMYLIEQNSNIIIVSSSTSTEPTPKLSQSHIQNKNESERSVASDAGQHVIIQASEESTPKFKENQESIRYRKKSHKNSFGGDFQITGYKQLANLINKSQAGADTRKQQSKTKKVFSQKFYMQQIGFTLQDSPIDKQINEQVNTLENQHDRQFQFGVEKGKDKVQMRGSNIEGYQGRSDMREAGLKMKEERKKHITSSQIFQLKKNLGNSSKKLQALKPEEEQSKSNTNSNSVGLQKNKSMEAQGPSVMKQHIHVDIDLVRYQKNQGNQLQPNTSTKQNIKITFSKKDSDRFIFKQIQSQYNDHQHPEQYPQLKDSPTFPTPKQGLTRTSLTNFRNNEGYTTLTTQNQYIKNRQANRRSLLLQSGINPIQEEMQSSQQERTETQRQSVAQSQKEKDLQYRGEGEGGDQRMGDREYLEQSLGDVDHRNRHNQQSNVNHQLNNLQSNKNYMNIFKPKNRKFSYLTQPIIPSKNSLLPDSQLRQSYIDQLIQIYPHHPGHPSQPPQAQPSHSPNRPHIFHPIGTNITKNKNKAKNMSNKSNKKVHKNSEAITEAHEGKKRRFEENPISFSQMIAQVNAGEESNFSGHSGKGLVGGRREVKLSYNSGLYKFNKNNIMCYNQPEGWVRKQVIYYFNDQPTEQLSSLSTSTNINTQSQSHPKKPQRYIIDRSVISTHQFEQISQQSSVNEQGNNNNNNNVNNNFSYQNGGKINGGNFGNFGNGNGKGNKGDASGAFVFPQYSTPNGNNVGVQADNNIFNSINNNIKQPQPAFNNQSPLLPAPHPQLQLTPLDHNTSFSSFNQPPQYNLEPVSSAPIYPKTQKSPHRLNRISLSPLTSTPTSPKINGLGSEEFPVSAHDYRFVGGHRVITPSHVSFTGHANYDQSTDRLAIHIPSAFLLNSSSQINPSTQTLPNTSHLQSTPTTNIRSTIDSYSYKYALTANYGKKLQKDKQKYKQKSLNLGKQPTNNMPVQPPTSISSIPSNPASLHFNPQQKQKVSSDSFPLTNPNKTQAQAYGQIKAQAKTETNISTTKYTYSVNSNNAVNNSENVYRNNGEIRVGVDAGTAKGGGQILQHLSSKTIGYNTNTNADPHSRRVIDTNLYGNIVDNLNIKLDSPAIGGVHTSMRSCFNNKTEHIDIINNYVSKYNNRAMFSSPRSLNLVPQVDKPNNMINIPKQQHKQYSYKIIQQPNPSSKQKSSKTQLMAPNLNPMPKEKSTGSYQSPPHSSYQMPMQSINNSFTYQKIWSQPVIRTSQEPHRTDSNSNQRKPRNISPGIRIALSPNGHYGNSIASPSNRLQQLQPQNIHYPHSYPSPTGQHQPKQPPMANIGNSTNYKPTNSSSYKYLYPSSANVMHIPKYTQQLVI